MKNIETLLELNFYELDALVYFLRENRHEFLSSMRELDAEYQLDNTMNIISKLESALEDTV